MSSETEYFPKPLFCSVDKAGCIHLGWIEGPQGDARQKRFSIYIDAESYNQDEELKCYGILTPPIEDGEAIELKSPNDIIKALNRYFSIEIPSEKDNNQG